MGALQNLEKGDVVDALRDAADWVENRVEGLESKFPVLGQFVQQFASDFGQKLLTDAEAVAPAVVAGTTSITSAASTLFTEAEAQAASLSVSDATTLALNALRVHVTALTSSAAPPAEAPPAAAQP